MVETGKGIEGAKREIIPGGLPSSGNPEISKNGSGLGNAVAPDCEEVHQFNSCALDVADPHPYVWTLDPAEAVGVTVIGVVGFGCLATAASEPVFTSSPRETEGPAIVVLPA